MDYQMFLYWLETEKSMCTRSARDVVSRLRRVLNMLDIDNFNENPISKLSDVESFNSCSMFIKSQLRRSVALYLEYTAQT